MLYTETMLAYFLSLLQSDICGLLADDDWNKPKKHAAIEKIVLFQLYMFYPSQGEPSVYASFKIDIIVNYKIKFLYHLIIWIGIRYCRFA